MRSLGMNTPCIDLKGLLLDFLHLFNVGGTSRFPPPPAFNEPYNNNGIMLCIPNVGTYVENEKICVLSTVGVCVCVCACGCGTYARFYTTRYAPTHVDLQQSHFRAQRCRKMSTQGPHKHLLLSREQSWGLQYALSPLSRS